MENQRLLDVPEVLDLPRPLIGGRWSGSTGALGGGHIRAAQLHSTLHDRTAESDKYLSGCRVHPGTSCTSPSSFSIQAHPAPQLGSIRTPRSPSRRHQLSSCAGLAAVAL